MKKKKDEAMNEKILVYVGTNSVRGSQGIYTLELKRNGSFQKIGTAETENSAYLCITADGKRIFSVIESLEYDGKAGGGVAAWKVNDGELDLVNQLYAEGGWPCHISLSADEKEVYVSVFRNGLWNVYPVGEKGELRERRISVRHSEPNGRPSHIHAAVSDPKGHYIIVADCGLDRLYVYGASGGKLVECVEMPQDSGPRQLAFDRDGKYLYMVTETSCEVYVMKYQPEEKKKLQVIQVISTKRSDGYQGENYAGGLHIHPSGRFLMVSNRGHNSIAVFRIDPDNGKLQLAGHKMLAGDHCREFAFTEDGKIMVVGLQHTDVVQSFFFNENTGKFTDTGHWIEIPSPSGLIIYEKNTGKEEEER